MGVAVPPLHNLFVHTPQYRLKDAIPIPKYFIVPKSQHTKTLRLQPGSPALIFFNLLVMLASIHFDNQALFKADKINDVSP